ncbi:uncharacterized protein UV8b_07173 [Ustilaginoidea virens]|uniref:Uncharacterized protein n=1 Tax=Ustilaginoidea virens TaxID=1159556 RepID=A0A063BRZ4_USTVR|nr:uncharacterized protein UV8b_07173 [Ustilaginoidea virens]QUC22932.1 hypothetical protein UV8b_07173 [Ustilaginoidea virens]GAO17571.1 hypothetical protein UVI_02047400 [Ustilaginoidea virens]
MLYLSVGQGLALLSLTRLARSLDVPVSFYSSVDCKTASAITPSAALNLSTCIVTPGLVSLRHGSVPCAGGGTVVPYLFDDAACATRQGVLDFYKTGSDFLCLSDFASKSIAAIMLSCNRKRPERPQATSTVSVAPVATGAAAAASSATARPSSGSSAGSGSEPDIAAGWRSLSLGARIGIIAGAAVVALSLLACALCCCCCRKPPSPRDPQQPYHNNEVPYGYDPAWKAPKVATRDVSRADQQHPAAGIASPTQPWELPGVSQADAYARVVENVTTAARQHARSGAFDNSGMTTGGICRNGDDALPPDITSAAFAKHDKEWKHRLGAAGELYVFEYLQSLGLPNFGPRNWTSSLRMTSPSNPDLDGAGPAHDGIADIEYPDETGAFTEFLVARGYSRHGIQSGMRPTYYFEVKATTGPNRQAPFYMSDNQEAHIRDALISPGQTRRVYIICRITNLGGGSGTRLAVFLDPEAMRRRGELIFSASDTEDGSWTVRPA